MHIDALTAAEQRVLGCLIEKRLTTPDQYPLTLNSLRLACNQSTNREPVLNYDETTVREAAQRLTKYGLARLASGHSSRAVKYRHLAEDALGVDQGELALLAVLLLRGEQTPGELKARTERMASFASLELVDAALAALCERGYAQRIERRPGQKEDRYRQMLGEVEGAGTNGGVAASVVAAPAGAAFGWAGDTAAGAAPAPVRTPGLAGAERDAIEARLASLEAQVERLAEALGELLGRQRETN